HVEGVADIGFRVEVDLELLETQGGDKGADPIGPGAVLGDRGDCELIAKLRLEAVERGHLLQTGLAPRRPQIDDDRLALEIGKAHRLALGIGEPGLWRWLRRALRDKLAEP